MMTPSCGVYWVCLHDPMASIICCDTVPLLPHPPDLLCCVTKVFADGHVLTEHARLKDHVASMTGGLEAKIHEGGKHAFAEVYTCPTCCSTILRRICPYFFISYPISHDLPNPFSSPHTPPFSVQAARILLTSPLSRLQPLPRPTPARLPSPCSPHPIQHPCPR